MTAVAALAATAFLLGVIAGPALGRSSRPHRLPGVTMAAWLGILAGTLAALAGLVSMALLGRPGLGHHLIEWLLSCLKHHKHPSSNTTYAISVLPLMAAIALAAIAFRRYRHTLLQRRHHRDALGFVVAPMRDFQDVCLINHPLPVVYCLPERERRIVMSKGALDRLDNAQLHAVLCHERAHLGGRHHFVLALIDAAGSALGWLPSFRTARDHLPPLLEMIADDEAATHSGPHIVAAALRRLAVLPCPAGALAAGSADRSILAQRLARLEAGTTPHGVCAHMLSRVAIAFFAVTPLIICALWAAAIPLFC